MSKEIKEDSDTPIADALKSKKLTAPELFKKWKDSQTRQDLKDVQTGIAQGVTGGIEHAKDVASKAAETARQVGTGEALRRHVTVTGPNSSDAKVDLKPVKPEYESGGKKKKMSEDTNSLIAAFLKIQENSPENMFEAARKAKIRTEGGVENIMNPNSSWAKKQAADKSNPFNEPTPDPTKVAPNIMIKGAGGDGTRTIGDKLKSLFREEKLSKKQDEKLDVVDDDKIDAKDFAALRAGKKKKVDEAAGDETAKRETSIGNVTKDKPKEDPSLPKTYPGAASSLTPDNPTTKLFKDKINKEEVEFSQAELDHINSFFEAVAPSRPEVTKGVNPTVKNTDLTDETIEEKLTDAAKANIRTALSDKMKKSSAPARSLIKLAKSNPANVKEEEDLEEGQVTGPRSYKGSPDRKRKAVQMALGRKHKDHPDWNPRTNPQYSALKLGRQLQKQGVKEETLEEGRPKKNPEPETTDRDPRQHIQVQAGRAAAGNVIDFKHENGQTSKITPGMGRAITAHLNSLKPADRQKKVNAMHASPEGLKV